MKSKTPLYCVLCTAQTFNGVGRTKKRAKQCAAQTALHSCIQFQHQRQTERYADVDERRRRGVMAVEDFTSDDVDDIQLDPHLDPFYNSAVLNGSDKWNKKFQSESRRLLFWTGKFSSLGLEDRLEASTLGLLFSHVERSSTLDFADGENKEFQSRRSECSPWARKLGHGLVEDWSTQTDVKVRQDGHPSSSWSTQRRWWNPVAVLSDLRPNIQYHRGVDNDDGNDGADRGTPHCRRGGPVTITADVDGRRFQGRGRTTKQAKRQLAAEVLRTLFHLRFIGQKPRAYHHNDIGFT